MQHLIFVAPDAAKLILRPATLRAGDDLILANLIETPPIRFEIGGQHIDRRGLLAAIFKFVAVHHWLAIEHFPAARKPPTEGNASK